MKILSLFILFALAAQTRVVRPPPPPPPPPVRVSGTIAQTGQGVIEGGVMQPGNGVPVADAAITLTGPPGSNGAVPQLHARTDSSGRFIFRNLPDAIYSVAARRPDYWGPAPASNINGQPVAATVVEIGSASGTANVTLNLTPGGLIRGIVRRPDGAFAAVIEVTVLRITYRDGLRTLESIRTARTDDRGEYRFPGLPPAEFYIRAEMMDASDAMAYYPAALDPELAVPVPVRGGDEVIADIELVSTPAFRISGTVLNTIPESADAPMAFMLIPTDFNRLAQRDPSRWFANQLTDPDGRFEILVSQPGTYHLMPVAPAKRDSTTPDPAGPRFFTGQVDIDIRDRDVQGVRVPITRGSNLPIQVSVPGGAALAAPLVLRLRPADPHQTILHAHLDSQIVPPGGKITFSNVPEGKYHLLAGTGAGLPFGALPSGHYIQDVLQAGRSTSADGLITVRGDIAEPVNVVLAAGGGTVEVAVDGILGKPESNIQVSLVPQGLRPNPMFYRRSFALDGSVRFEEVAPGDYRVFAWEDLSQGADENAAVIARYDSQSRTVSVRSKNTSAVRVPLISRRD